MKNTACHAPTCGRFNVHGQRERQGATPADKAGDIRCKLAVFAMAALLFLGAMAPTMLCAADFHFFRIMGSTSTVITALGADGTITWTNADVGVVCKVETVLSVDPGAQWERYTEIIATSQVSRLRIFDPNPPAGMVFIPAGSFVMGNATNMLPNEDSSEELPQHTVSVSAFYMDQYEVTKALWDEVRAWATNQGFAMTTGGGKAGNHPVHSVNWFDMVKWCNARSQRDGLTPVYYTDAGLTTVCKTGEIEPFANWAANGYRLPTEAEWEKAARGGAADMRFPWTDYTNKISWAKANYYGYSSRFSYDLDGGSGAFHPTFATNGQPYTSPVGYFAPNGYGLYDMAGNAFEWCWDWYGASYYSNSPPADPRGPYSGDFGTRVLRGGSWFDGLEVVTRVAYRYHLEPNFEVGFFGFRCARGL